MDYQSLTDEDVYALAKSLRAIGTNLASASFLQIASAYAAENPLDMTSTAALDSHKLVDEAKLQSLLLKHVNLNRAIDYLNLRQVHLLKPLADGKTIQVLYECKAGKWLKETIERVVRFQILNPSATMKEVEAHLLENRV
mmetsp:Transcript_3802/g.5745  ORF Transcript_3802/g.5745 Transcript_3802/m.5745 type:complete len:140 (-) Transcript_3802:6-425(-)